MDLSDWILMFKFGRNLFIYGKGNERVGVDKNGKWLISYKVGPDKSPRCEECQRRLNRAY